MKTTQYKMNKIKLILLSALALAMFCGNAIAAEGVKVGLDHGVVQVYDFGTIKLHAYQTADPMLDECFLIETGKNLIGIESPPFEINITEWKDYIASTNKPLTDIFISAHPGGGNWFGQAKSHANASANTSITSGATKALTENLGKKFGAGFNTEMPRIDSILKEGRNTIGGVTFMIINAGDCYDIAIPEIKAIYTHMLGADTHSILASQDHIKAVIASLESMKANGYQLILSSHHTPETPADVDTKLSYVKKMGEIAAESSDKESFIAKVVKAFPDYNRMNYLDMTAGYLFSK